MRFLPRRKQVTVAYLISSRFWGLLIPDRRKHPWVGIAEYDVDYIISSSLTAFKTFQANRFHQIQLFFPECFLDPRTTVADEERICIG